jgi:hypothetical protein
MRDQTYIVKPDGGALGIGIEILNPGSCWRRPDDLCVVQEYVKPCLLGGFKFDLRIYALIASIKPLQIWIFRDGIALVCSEKYGSQSRAANITNTAVNRNLPGVKIEDITKLVSEVLPRVFSEAKTAELWRQIDDIVVLTVISGLGYLLEELRALRRNNRYLECFQLLGFDIMLTEQQKPVLLEVNYRPSLGADTDNEMSLKRRMMTDMFHVVVRPLIDTQNAVLRKSGDRWREFFEKNNTTGGFRKIYDEREPDKWPMYSNIIKGSLAQGTGWDGDPRSPSVPRMVPLTRGKSKDGTVL